MIIFTALLAVFYVSHVTCIVTRVDRNTLGAASTTFGLEIYQKIAKTSDNIVISPYSLHSALTMTSMGAANKTLAEMRSSLGLSNLPGPLAYETYQSALENLTDVSQGVEVSIANGLFVNPRFKIYQNFKDSVSQKFDAVIENINFAAKGGPQTPINNWITKKTRGLIKDAVEPGVISPLTIALLVNTVFFNGSWAQPFQSFSTREEKFTKADGSQSTVNMMKMTNYVQFKSDGDKYVVRLPYMNARFALYLTMPKQASDFDKFESSLKSANDVFNIAYNMTWKRIQLKLPRFKIGSSNKLVKVLKTIGMKLAFEDTANFRKLSPKASHISAVIHDALIQVNEEGTTAAAATIVAIVTKGLPMVRESVTFNRPFMFFLRDDHTQSVLFMGKIAKPEFY